MQALHIRVPPKPSSVPEPGAFCVVEFSMEQHICILLGNYAWHVRRLNKNKSVPLVGSVGPSQVEWGSNGGIIYAYLQR